MVTTCITQTSIFSHTYRLDPTYLTVRAGSTHFMLGGTTHQVTGGHIHDLYNPSNSDYDVAVLKVCTESIKNRQYKVCDVFVVTFSFTSFIVL